MSENEIKLSEKAEIVLVSAVSFASAVATGVWTQPIDINVKTAVSGIAGTIALGLGAVWARLVNKPKPEA